MNYVFRHAWMNDFSFVGVERSFLDRFGGMLNTPISVEQEEEARKLIVLDEARRLQSMAQYEKDGIVPFMRRPSLQAATGVKPNADIGTL